MDIYERLITDHENQRNLFAKAVETEGDSKARQEIWQKIKIELEAHAAAEEQVFYAELMSHPKATEKARHSVAEHKDATDLIEDIEETDMSSPAWLPKLKSLKDSIEHHLEEEEKDVFPLAKDLISSSLSISLTDDFNKRKPAEKEKQAAS